MEENLLTVTEAAAKLNVSARTVQRYCKQGRLAHQWIIGKRHRELRVVPPIPLSQLPGGRRKTLAGTFDYVTREAYESDVESIRAELAEKDRRIVLLEQEIQLLKERVTANADAQSPGNPVNASFTEVLNRIRELIDDYEKIRSAEKKLVLKLAREVQEHEQYLVGAGKHPYPYHAGDNQ